MKRGAWVWVVIGLLTLTNIVSVLSWRNALAHSRHTDAVTKKQEAYPLLAKRIFVESPNDVIINFSPLRAALNQYFEKNVTANYSFYFEYLPTGSSIRINSNDELIGASLLKLPVVMNLYKAEELGKVQLNQKVTLKQEWLDNQFGSLYKRGAGAQLSMQELAQYVLRESDNTAANAIYATVNPLLPEDEHALVELDVPHTITDQQRTKIGAQSYTSLLKCLYFSCFVNEDHSQQILSLMTQAPYEGRLGAGVPENVKVAHKIGTYSNLTEGDCGIVYLESRNYAACMLIDLPSAQANRHMQMVSSLIYQYMSAQE
jgi:beta-lactamase class A